LTAEVVVIAVEGDPAPEHIVIDVVQKLEPHGGGPADVPRVHALVERKVGAVRPCAGAELSAGAGPAGRHR
jgi:hypothetical protein